MKKHTKYFLQSFLVAAFALGLSLTPGYGATASSQVVPPKQKAFEMSYGEWSARWWQFVFGLPEANNPLADPTGAQCTMGQWGPVIFLMGTTGGGPVVRSCTIPGRKGLLIPIVNFGGAVPEDGPTPADVTSVAAGAADLIDVSTLSVAIDGIAARNLEKYRFRSPVFSFTGSSPNIFSASCGTPPCYEGFHEQAVADGYWVLLNPLPAGKHTIHFHGEVPDWGFVVDVTYHLKVLP
ncbi:MAG: hypothetical protein ABSG54_09780 [Terriglobia bacterium]|jgi:hypothetical protein